MTEEIIIFEQDGNIVGITKEGKYFESYKTTENVAILRGAGLYIKRLEQENKELQAYKDINEDFKKAWDELNEKYKQLRSALEEIREKAKHCIKQDVCALCDYNKECAVPDADGLVYNNNRFLIKLINEVLNDK